MVWAKYPNCKTCPKSNFEQSLQVQTFVESSLLFYVSHINSLEEELSQHIMTFPNRDSYYQVKWENVSLPRFPIGEITMYREHAQESHLSQIIIHQFVRENREKNKRKC